MATGFRSGFDKTPGEPTGPGSGKSATGTEFDKLPLTKHPMEGIGS